MAVALVVGASQWSRKEMSPASKQEIRLTSAVVGVVIACPKPTKAGGLVVVGAKAPKTTAEGHSELVRRVARLVIVGRLAMRGWVDRRRLRVR